MPSLQSSTFSSARLHYRAIRQPEDLIVFKAINADETGYQNSNFSNIKLPGPADAEKFLKSTAEESLLGAVIWLPFTSEPRTPEWVAEFLQQKEQGGIVDEEWGTAIGELHLSALQKHQTHHRWTEIGLDILPAYQGRGYGGEAINWALDYAFRRAGLHRVQIRAFEWNTGAIRLYEKLGFKHEGREREKRWHEGRWWDELGFSMLESEWWAIQKAKQEAKSELV